MVKNMKRIFAIFIILGLFCIYPVWAADYLVGRQDILRITVYQQPDLNTIARVTDEGSITFPLLGEVQVNGLSVQQIEKRLSDLLSEGLIIKNPQVSVFIEQYRSQRVTIIGEVNKPGQYEITRMAFVSDILSMAGGLSGDAGNSITILKKADNGQKGKNSLISINLLKLLKYGEMSEDVHVSDGDIIYVPRVDLFYIYGEVNRPGSYRLEPGLTVIRAICIAGGFTTKGSKRRVKITRRKGYSEEIIKGKLNDAVNPDDVIRVAERLF
ncbi:MAG: SLBB domain-containing protein [Nitrospinota bacterium]